MNTAHCSTNRRPQDWTLNAVFAYEKLAHEECGQFLREMTYTHIIELNRKPTFRNALKIKRIQTLLFVLKEQTFKINELKALAETAALLVLKQT